LFDNLYPLQSNFKVHKLVVEESDEQKLSKDSTDSEGSSSETGLLQKRNFSDGVSTQSQDQKCGLEPFGLCLNTPVLILLSVWSL
jgi:hypothetical protein